jgi:predicted amidohydrolase
MSASPDLIVFPEDIGTGLVGLGTEFASEASSLRQAIVAIGIRNIGRALHLLLRPSLSVPRALLLAIADQMREVYVSTFSELSSACDVHIAAGTILLPHEQADDQAVHNTFYLFGPDGEVLETADKVNLIGLEGEDGLDLTPGRDADLTVWHTPIGSLAPVICYDAWDAGLVERMVNAGAQMLIVPAPNPEPWDERVSRERREGMYARVAELGVPGVEAFAVGHLAGMPFEGRSWILVPDPGEPNAVRTLARAQSPTEPEVISATVPLPASRGMSKEDAPDGAGSVSCD